MRVLSTKNFLRSAMPRSQFSFSRSCSLEGRKKTFSSNTSDSLTCDLSAGLGILLQASSTLAINFSLSASGFSFFSTKSLTTKRICLGLSEPKSLRLSSRMTSSISSCAPLKVPICWIQMLMSSVCEMANANSEFLRYIFCISPPVPSAPTARWSRCPPHPRSRCSTLTPR